MESIQEDFLEEVQCQCLKDGEKNIVTVLGKAALLCSVVWGENRGGRGWREAEDGDKGFWKRYCEQVV